MYPLMQHRAMQEHIEQGRPDAESVRAAVFGPALADFDALLLLRRDALPAADLALLAPKAWRAAAARAGFAPLPAEAAAPGAAAEGKSARALLRAVPPGGATLSWCSCSPRHLHCHAAKLLPPVSGAGRYQAE